MPAVVVLHLMVLMSNKVGCLLQLLLKSAYSALFPFLCFFLFLLISRICYLLLTTQIFIANNLFPLYFFPVCLVTPGFQAIHFLYILEYTRDFEGASRLSHFTSSKKFLFTFMSLNQNLSFLSREQSRCKHWNAKKIHLCILRFWAIFHL